MLLYYFFKSIIYEGVIPKKIYFLNILILLIKSSVYILEILGLSTLVIFLLEYLSGKTSQISLIQNSFDLNFIFGSISTLNIFNLILFIFSLRFLFMIFFSYLLEKIKNDIYLFYLSRSLNFIFKSEDKSLVNKNNISIIYRNVTSEIKFSSNFIVSLFNVVGNIFIFFGIFIFMSRVYGMIVILSLIIILIIVLFFHYFFSAKLKKYNLFRINLNKEFYNEFHTEIENKINGNKLNLNLFETKSKEWRYTMLTKFFHSITRIFIEYFAIIFFAVMINFNYFYNLSNDTLIILILIIMRSLPLIKELQDNINTIYSNYNSFLAVKKFIRSS